MNRISFPFLVLCLWVALIGVLVWNAASTAVEPPVWDSMSYFDKGMNFWTAVAAGTPFNPFDLEPTLRPPGTILMSHPFGFSESYYGFYFRSVFIPILLLAAAALVANPEQRITWPAVIVGFALTSMPMLYQFQASDLVPWDVNWGMVDNFMAGAAALSAASVLRSVRLQSVGWAAVAALASSLCFLIKPSGLITMGLAGLSWAILLWWQYRDNVSALWKDASLRNFAVLSLVSAFVIFAVTVYFAVTSQYFSLENVLFGNRVIAVLADEISAGVDVATLAMLVNISLGSVLTVLTLLGLGAGIRDASYGRAGVALMCAIIGIWFWYFITEPWEPRYFVPFGLMAFMLITPDLIRAFNTLPASARRGAGLLTVIPGVMIAVLLATPQPSLELQRALGINLTTSLFKNETEQAYALLRQLRDDGIARTSAYFFNNSAPQRSVQAVLNYMNLVDRESPQISTNSPIDWQRPNAFRIEDMLRSEFLIFEPIADDDVRDTILGKHAVPDFYTQISVMSAWATTLSASQGVQNVSDTQVRILKVVDPKALEYALEELIAQHEWPASFLKSNQPRWWSGEDLAKELAVRNAGALNVSFGSVDSENLATLRAIAPDPASALLEIDAWIETALPAGWTLFGHIIDQSGTILANEQVNLVDQTARPDGRNIRRYTLSYPGWPATASGIAVGFFKPKGEELEFLLARDGQRDWDHRRLVIPRPAQ